MLQQKIGMDIIGILTAITESPENKKVDIIKSELLLFSENIK